MSNIALAGQNMDVTTYFRSLTSEMASLKDRVRNFIADAHWQTDGEWKESVLRSFLRRTLPANIEVGRGFVVGPRATSDQIDVLLYSTDKPVLFRDGNLVFVTHDALVGMIEVKSSVNNHTFARAVEKLAENAFRVIPHTRSSKIVGLFAYESEGLRAEAALDALKEAAHGISNRIVDVSSVGADFFVRWWHLEPRREPGRGRPLANRWHAYHLESMAPAYFLHNVVEFLNPECVEQNQGVWFPPDGKEAYKIGDIKLWERGDQHPPAN